MFLMGLMLLVSGAAVGHSEVALAASDPVIAAAGDIACDPANSVFNSGSGTSGACHQKYTSDLLVRAGLAAVLPLGDVQYFCGGYQAFLQSYDLSWGRVKSISHPVVGNHEYITSGDPNGPSTGCDPTNENAAGYFNYFGAAAGVPGQGYYSYDIGAWHLIALSSNCGDAGGCSFSSPQGQWLEADLNAHSNFCTLAYWHIPLFSSGGRAEINSKDLFQILYNHNADLILNGHDHIYERFAPQAPNGVADTIRGMREFIVGSGGANHTSLTTIAANSELRNVDTFGVLKLTLHPTSYDWQFVPQAGQTFTDSGTGVCHGSSTATITPTFLFPTSTPTKTPSPTRTAIPMSTAPNPGDATFADVSSGNWAWQFIETLYKAGITDGCGISPLVYCPASPVTRSQMAIFLLRAKHGSGYAPPAPKGTVFNDVSKTYWAAAWIERLAAEGIATGCGNGNFCPTAEVTRDQMAVFLVRTFHLP